jgi:hypothetical protein
MSQKPTDIQNQSPATSKPSGVLQNDPSVSPIQHLANSVKWIRKKHASTSKTSAQFGGIVLSASDMSLDKFLKKYPADSSFYKSVMQKSGKVLEPKKDASIVKVHCYIPEVSGILPFPDYKTYQKYLDLYAGTGEPIKQEGQKNDEFEKVEKEYSAKRKKDMKEIYPDLYKEFTKIIMHPVFYKYSESGAPPGIWEYVTVSYTKDFDSMHTGVLEESHGDFYRG